MSNDIAEPRRTGRDRKQVDKFEPQRAQKGKARVTNHEESDEESEDESSDEGEDDDDHRPAAKAKAPAKRAANGTKKGKSTTTSAPAAKRQRKTKVSVNGNANGANGPTEGQSETFKTDSSFFNALLSADIALATLVEDWVDNYQSTANDDVSEKAAVHELILFVIRACGLGADITEDEAMDVDGVLDAVETIQDESVRVAAASYPLISKQKTLKPFKTNLDLFISLLINTMAISNLLFEEAESTSHTIPLISILLTWLNTMASSPLRPIRHTSTYIALKIVTELCVQAGDVSKELNLRQRQKDMEAKKSGVGPAYQKKMREAEAKVREVHEKKARLEEIMKDSFDTLFVHRVRDVDPNIRTDCLKELGVWVRKYPDLYTGNSFLQYLSRGTNDPNSHARLEAVKAFASLLSKETFITNARTNIMRISSRLIEISLRDVDTNVRINALKALALLDKTGVLQDEEDDQRSRVIRVVFDQEPRVRRAVGDFVKGYLAEKTEALESTWSAVKGTKKKRGAKISEKDMRTYLGWKTLASMLVETYHELDSREASTSTAPTVSVSMGRATAAVEALRSSVEGLTNWQELVDYLLVDHSTAESDMWLLLEEEEDFMIQVLIACIKADAAEDEENKDEQTKSLMKVFPRLLAKHQADDGRTSALLTVPAQMNLSLYLDMRMTSAYDSLWDDIIRQFLQHTDRTVLTSAILAINELTLNTSLAEANTAKLNALTESLFTSLRDAIDGRDVSSMSIDDEEIASLEAILFRLTLLAKSRDITEVMEDEEGGQSSGWEIVCAFAERGELPYKDEAKIIEYAIQAVFLHLTWLFKNFTTEDKEDGVKILALNEKRDRAIEIFQKLALKELSNAPISVRRQAFITFVNLHILFSAKAKSQDVLPAAQACPLVMPAEIQTKLGGALQAAVERYATDRSVAQDAEDEDAQAVADDDEFSSEKASSEIQFLQQVAVFVGAIRCGVLDSDHSKEVLGHCGRFGATYDAIAKKLVDVLRDEGIYNRDSEVVVAISVDALQASYDTYLDTEELEPIAPLVLTKILASSFTIHGNHFTILKHLHPNDAQNFHIDSISASFRKMASYVQQERKATRKDSKGRYADKRAQVLTIFKCLILLLGPVNGRGALKIKSEMESGLRDANVEVTGHKMWEGYRAFEKRLVLIASKDDNIRAGAARVMEQEQEQEQDQEQEGTERSVSPTPGPTANLVADDEEEEEDAGPDIDMDEQPDEELDFDLGDLDDEPQTPGTKRSRSIAVGSVRPTKKAKK